MANSTPYTTITKMENALEDILEKTRLPYPNNRTNGGDWRIGHSKRATITNPIYAQNDFFRYMRSYGSWWILVRGGQFNIAI